MSFLLGQGVSALPISPGAAARQSGWEVSCYAAFAARIHKDVAHLKAVYDNDGFVFWSEKKKSYVLCYDDNAPANEIRWTLTHEIGHIVLSHVSPSCPILARNGIGNVFYEMEADNFALRVLCPACILQECRVDTLDSIVNMCGIPCSCARSALTYVQRFSADRQTAPLVSRLKCRFADFIKDNKKNRPDNRAARVERVQFYETSPCNYAACSFALCLRCAAHAERRSIYSSRYSCRICQGSVGHRFRTVGPGCRSDGTKACQRNTV